MWGKLRLPVRTMLRTRITPTYVGKTSLLFLFCFSFPDHPHLCGENETNAVKSTLSFNEDPIFNHFRFP